MTTAFKPFTTANAVSSIDLLRPTDQAPSPEETLDVTIAAWTQAQQVEITPTRTATQAEHFLHSRKTALQQAAEDVYMTAFEHASPEHRDSLLQTLHQDRLTLTGWANNQAAPTLTEIHRTALRREYNSLFGFPIITSEAVRWISQVTAGHPFLEIGAGNGYLAAELIKAGIDVIPTDPHPIGAEDGHRIPMAPVPSVDILPLTGKEAIALHPERDILWSWPDLNAEYTHQTLRNFEGRFLVYIGEDIHRAPPSFTTSSKPTSSRSNPSKYRHSQGSTTASSSTNAPAIRWPVGPPTGRPPSRNPTPTPSQRPQTLRNRPRQPGRHPPLRPRYPRPTRPLPPHIPASPRLIITGHRVSPIRTSH